MPLLHQLQGRSIELTAADDVTVDDDRHREIKDGDNRDDNSINVVSFYHHSSSLDYVRYSNVDASQNITKNASLDLVLISSLELPYNETRKSIKIAQAMRSSQAAIVDKAAK